LASFFGFVAIARSSFSRIALMYALGRPPPSLAAAARINGTGQAK
jgi:hypothetical protein